LVDKPGRRKIRKVPWGKVAGVAIVAILAVAVSWEVYWTYVYQTPPVYASIATSQGTIYVELYPGCAPKTVANFESLANSSFYDDLVWHRIIPGFVIQTGDPNTRGAVNSTRSTWGTGGSNTSVPFEWCGRLHNYAGYLAMASTTAMGPSTSQFYINLSNDSVSQLDGNYTVFGKVISGMNVVCKIANPTIDPTYASTSNLPDQPIYPARAMLDNVTIITASQAPAPQPITACS
jgi:dolichyl-diphosphooligosaccharide---protein glycosyltransferase